MRIIEWIALIIMIGSLANLLHVIYVVDKTDAKTYMSEKLDAYAFVASASCFATLVAVGGV